jgi:putative ABC transport system ATP-binding protein
MTDAAAATELQPQTRQAVVEAHEITRRYGAGETAVDALRGIDLEVEQGQLTAIMGPSGSGKSTLMHILAALDRPTSGYVQIAGTRLGQLSDNEVTRLRRRHIGFVFQFFNLLPMLTAEENVLLPLSIAGTKPDREFYEDLLGRSARAPSPTASSTRTCSGASASPTAARTGPRSSRAANSSASRSPARS